MKKIFFFSYLFIFSLFIYSKSFGDGPLHELELILHTQNCPSQLVFNINSISPVVWEAHHTGDYYVHITNDLMYIDPGEVIMPGSYTVNDKGWNTDKVPNELPPPPVLGRGVYQITVFAKNIATMDTLIVNCYGTNFLYQGLDCIITYDYSGNGGNGAFFHNDEEITQIRLYNHREIGLQPTSPINFRCTNTTSYGQNPEFEWQVPYQPEDVSFKYKIYRKKDSGTWILQQDNITITEWTDEEVEIDSVHSNTYSYYATAHTNLSPESDPSYVETVHGFRGKNKPFQQDEESNRKILNENNFYCTNYPNPFNPTTNIFYSVPSEGFIQLKFYNISGQLVKELTNKFHPAGTYQTSFNGANLTAGIYFVVFFYDQQKFLTKILLTK